MRMVAAQFPWEIPQPSHVLIASALARARPVALTASPARLNGLSQAEVALRYQALTNGILALDADAARALAQLEREPADQSYPLWETLVMRTGAADDGRIIALAREVWVALGSNEYAVHLRARPRTSRGFMEGRAWLGLGVFGGVAVAIAAGEAQGRWGAPWWLWLPAMVAWPLAVLWLFRRRYRRAERRGGTELPHF